MLIQVVLKWLLLTNTIWLETAALKYLDGGQCTNLQVKIVVLDFLKICHSTSDIKWLYHYPMNLNSCDHYRH